MSAPMNLNQYNALVEHISKNHAFGHGGKVKYMDYHHDFRTNTVFCVGLRGLFGEKSIPYSE